MRNLPSAWRRTPQVNARDNAGNIVVWNPSGSNLVNDQFNLCTSCHNLKTFDGSKTMASGTAASGTVPVGNHENTWYRVIATTHNNNLDNETNGISGYVLRTNGETACFDCHGHEARTEPAITLMPHRLTRQRRQTSGYGRCRLMRASC